MGLSEVAAQSIGIPEPSARFLLALFSAHLFAVVYRTVMVDQHTKLKSLYCAVTGICIILYVYGFLIWHSLLDTLVVYLVLHLFGGSVLSVALTMIFTMGHLLIGYAHIVMSERVHSIAWTIPHCVLVLKLIGLSFNLYDGKKNPEDQTEVMKKNAIHSLPSLLDVFAFCYFYASVLAGPQITFMRHKLFIEGRLFDWYKTPSSIPAGVQRLLSGVPIAFLYVVLNKMYPEILITSDIYLEQTFPTKVWWSLVCTKVMMWRYMIVWLIAESACIITGISYEGTDDSGNVNWAGLTNILIIKHEKAITFREIIESFNVNTNRWLSWYIHSRLKWLGNRVLSLALSMLFLSLWHGLWPGYYISFVFELVYITFENMFVGGLKKITGHNSLAEVPLHLRIPFFSIAYINRLFIFPYPLTPFMVLRWSDCYRYLKAVYFYGHLMVALMFLLYFLIVFPRLRRLKTKQT